MPKFNSPDQARNRLAADDSPLTETELQELIPMIRHFRVGGGLERIQAELIMRAFQNFNTFSSSNETLAKRMERLTCAILALTALATIASIIAIFK